MRLRTVITELACPDVRLGRDGLLETEVLLTPTTDARIPEGVRLLRLCPLASYASGMSRPQDGQILMVHTGGSIPRDVPCEGDVVLVAHPGSYEDLRMSFLDLPGRTALYQVRRSRLFEAFMSSYDIVQFAQRASHIIGNPLMIINTDQRILASGGKFREDSQDIREVVERGYVSESVRAQLDADGTVESSRRARHSVLTEGRHDGTRWACSVIRNHHLEMGRIDVREQDCRVTGFDLELIDFAGQLAGVMIERLGAAGEGVGSGSSVLSDLIAGAFANEETMRAQISLTQLPTDATYVLLSLRGLRGNVGRDLYARVGALVAPTLRGCLWCIQSDSLAVLAPLGGVSTSLDGYAHAQRQLSSNAALVQLLERNELMAYVSEPFDELSLCPERAQQCRSLVDAPAVREHGQIVFFWENRFAALAYSARTSGQTEMLLDKRVVAMSEYDRRHKTAYLETAIAAVRHPGSPADAAAALNVHRNTYFYRMNKVRDLFGIDLHDGDDRLALAFTASIMEGMDRCTLL